MIPTLHTERTLLRPIVTSDAEALFTYRSMPEVALYQGWAPTSLKDSLEWIEAQETTPPNEAGWHQWAIEAVESKAMIGDLGLHTLKGGRQAEFGITLTPTSQGQGLATEVLKKLLSYTFGTLKLHRVSASLDPRNKGSMALMKRAGMRLEAHHVKSYWDKDAWVDDMIFAILNEEWANPTPHAEL